MPLDLQDRKEALDNQALKVNVDSQECPDLQELKVTKVLKDSQETSVQLVTLEPLVRKVCRGLLETKEFPAQLVTLVPLDHVVFAEPREFLVMLGKTQQAELMDWTEK